MAIVKTDSKYYSSIADAIRAKGVRGVFRPSQMSGAIESITTGGAAVADGVVVTARNASGNPTVVAIYGSVIYPYTCGSSLGRNYMWFGNQITDISFESQITELKPNAFYNALGSNTDADFPSVAAVGNQAFYGSAFKSVRLPTSAVLGNEVFRLSSIQSITVLSSKIEANTSQTFRQWSGTSAVCGSVGNPWIAKETSFLGAANAQTITLYCTGTNAAANLSSIRNGAVNATIIIKASENTTFNGIAYDAGDTIITSTVEE